MFLPSSASTMDPSDQHHVDIQSSEQAFAELSRQLSRQLSTRTTSVESPEFPKDIDYSKVEKADNSDQRFDLRAYLSSSNDEHQAAGIQHKHVGVVWEDLQVHADSNRASNANVNFGLIG